MFNLSKLLRMDNMDPLLYDVVCLVDVTINSEVILDLSLIKYLLQNCHISFNDTVVTIPPPSLSSSTIATIC